MKKFFFILCTISLVVLTTSISGQEKLINTNFDLNSYTELTWFNCENPSEYLSHDDAIYLLVYWNNLNKDAGLTAKKIAAIKKKHKALHVVMIYNTLKKEEREYAHFRSHIIQHNIQVPTVINVDDEMQAQIKIEHYPSAILYSPKLGEIKNYIGIQAFDAISDDFSAEIKKPIHSNLHTYMKNHHGLVDDFPDPLLSRFSHITSVAAKDWIFLSQPQLNRIVLTDVQGNVLQVFGSGKPGISEGPISFIQFNHPQGLYWDEATQSLFVADTYNNCIRKVDFLTNNCSTVLDFSQISPTSYPTDICHSKGLLYIAVEGLNQVWTLDMSTNESGIIQDNLGKNMSFINPRSVAVDANQSIYVVEQETGKLIKFSNQLTASEIELPHPATDVIVADKKLIVTSAYGDKIFILEDDKIIKTAGNKSGYQDGKFDQASFLEPAGITTMNGLYYVIDRGNNLIRSLNIKNNRVSTVTYENMGVLTQRVSFSKDIIELEPIAIASGTNLIYITLEDNDDFQLDTRYGANELLPGNFPGKFMIDDADINDHRGTLSFEGEQIQGIIEIIVMATIQSKDSPKRFYQKMQRYYIPATLDPSATGTHDIVIPLID